jgi:hypothetical protein
MKEVKVIEIQSFNDIITNSSTEIYSSESNKNLEKTLQELGIDYFIVRDFKDILDIFNNRISLSRQFKDSDFLYEVELGINRTGREIRSGCDYLPRLTKFGYKQLRAIGYTDEKITEFFDPVYKACGVYGKVYITYYNMCSLKEKFPGHERTANKFKSLGLD